MIPFYELYISQPFGVPDWIWLVSGLCLVIWCNFALGADSAIQPGSVIYFVVIYTVAVSYTHLDVYKRQSWISAVRELLDETPDVEGGVTRIASGDVAVRILGRGAEPLLKISEKIQEMN